jgi:hypothetical protein
MDHPACCSMPRKGGRYGHYDSEYDAELAASDSAGMSRGRWEDDGLYCWKH